MRGEWGQGLHPKVKQVERREEKTKGHPSDPGMELEDHIRIPWQKPTRKLKI